MRKTAAASLRDPSKTQRPHRRGGGGRGIEKVREARFGWKTEWQLLRRGLSHLLKRTSPPLSAAEPWFAAPTPVNVQPRRAARIAGASLGLFAFACGFIWMRRARVSALPARGPPLPQQANKARQALQRAESRMCFWPVSTPDNHLASLVVCFFFKFYFIVARPPCKCVVLWERTRC